MINLNLHRILNWEDEALDEGEMNIQQSSKYTIKNVDRKRIKGLWTGNANVTSRDGEINGNVSLRGSVDLNTANPLVQKRTLEAIIEETYSGLFQVHVKASVQQIWQAMPE